MKKVLLCIGLIASFNVFAEEYSCKVYCLGPSGSTSTTVQASNPSDAANTVNSNSDQICRAAGFEKSTPQTMSPSQCSRN